MSRRKARFGEQLQSLKEKWGEKLRALTLPGFDKVPIFEVFRFFFEGFQKGALVTRASAIAFNLMLAMLPSTIFLFTLIPFIPISNFQNELVDLFGSILPENAYSFMETTIVDVITRKSGTLLLFMFLATLLFSTNGIHAIVHAFNVSTHEFDTRSWVAQRKIAIVLLLTILLLIAVSVSLIIFGKTLIESLMEDTNLLYYIFITLKWLVIFIILYLAISSLYYLAPARRSEFRFFSAGSSLATLLFVLTSMGFSWYVNHFGQWNKLYGSIGTLMVILVWLYLNSITLLIGFELNVSIRTANRNKLSLPAD